MCLRIPHATTVLLASLFCPLAAFAQVPVPVPAPLPANTPKTGWVEPVPVVAVPVAPAEAPPKVAPDPRLNQPPRIEHILPQRFDRFEITVPVDKPLSLTVEATDPEGMPLRVSLVGLPEGAEFSEALRTLTWKPTARQRGQHVVRFVAFDGEKEASRVMTINVSDNHAPVFVGEQPRIINVGDYSALALTASDPEEDPLTYVISGLPRGATFQKSGAMLSWRPEEKDVGDHVVRVTASDGSLQTTSDITIHVDSRASQSGEDWESYFLPGIGYSMYSPRLHEALGTFRGPTLEILLAAWIHRNENRGPSHGRVYANVEVLETDADVKHPLLLSYALGFSLSLERNPQRSFLIPSYGADFGGMTDYYFGDHFQSTPYIALHLFSNQNVFINARAGYRIVPADMEHLAGLHVGATADFSVW